MLGESQQRLSTGPLSSSSVAHACPTHILLSSYNFCIVDCIFTKESCVVNHFYDLLTCKISQPTMWLLMLPHSSCGGLREEITCVPPGLQIDHFSSCRPS
jgi:hypothetical protein